MITTSGTASIHLGVTLIFLSIGYLQSDPIPLEEFRSNLNTYEQQANPEDKLRGAITLYESARAIPDDPNLPEWIETIKRGKLKALIQSLNAIQANIIPNFDFNDKPTRNVSPPPNSGIDSGGLPEDIKDPKLRQQYIASIKQNNAKIEQLRQQIELANARDSCLAYIKAYVNAYYENDTASVKSITESLAISDEARKMILQMFSSAH